MKTKFIVLGVIYFCLSILILVIKLGDSEYERMRDSSSPFIYDSTKLAIRILDSAMNSPSSNWGKEMAVIMSPVAIAALPATIIADTLAFPYDYYLEKKTRKTRGFWKTVSREFHKEEDNPYPIEKYEAYFGDYGSYRIWRGRWFDGGSSLQEKYASVFFILSSKYSQYDMAGSIGYGIASSTSGMTTEIASNLYKIIKADPEKYQNRIITLLENRMVSAQIKEKLYTMLMSDKYEGKVPQFSILYKLKDFLEKRAKYHQNEKMDSLYLLKIERRLETLAVRELRSEYSHFTYLMGYFIVKSNCMTEDIAIDLYKVIDTDPREYHSSIIPLLDNKITPAKTKEKLYNMLLSDEYKNKAYQARLLEEFYERLKKKEGQLTAEEQLIVLKVETIL